MKLKYLLSVLLMLLILSAPASGEFVDKATGFFVYSATDLRIPAIMPVNITRYYQAGAGGIGAFGTGTYLEYDWWLGAYGADGNINTSNPTMLILVKPGNYQYRFDINIGNSVFINDRDPDMSGAILVINADYTKSLRTRDGSTYQFNVNGRLTEMADRNGNRLILTRRSAFEGEYLTGITTPEGRNITFNQTYTCTPICFYRMDNIVDDTGRTVNYSYDASNRLKTVTHPDGNSIQYQYDSSGRLSAIINEKGVTELLNEYNADNRVTKQLQADGGMITYEYTVAGGFVTAMSKTAPDGGTSTWRFNNWKYITEMTTPDGTTTYQRDPLTNRLTSVTDPLGRVMNYTYYANGQTQTVMDNLGNVTSYVYEPVYGLPARITDAQLKSTTFTYTYGANSQITKTEIKDPLQTANTSLLPTVINYNSNGLPISITDPNNNTTTLYYENTNRPSELTKITDALNNTSRMTYDSLGRLAATTDAKGKTTTYSYDIMGRVTEVKDPMSGVTRYTYDKKGNLMTVTDAKNHTIRYEYNDRDKVKKMTDQLGKVETYEYDTSDNLIRLTDRKGQITTYTYDLMNRVKKITYQDNSFTEYTYDAAGRLDYINDSVSGYIDYTYNDYGCTTCGGRGRDRIASETTALGTIDYTYDSMGRRTSMTVAGQPVVNYTYDDAGRLTGISTVNSQYGTLNFGFAYDNAGRRSAMTLPNGVTTSYAYDNASRLLNIDHLSPLSSVLEALSYTYDANGNRTKFTRNATQTLRDDAASSSCGITIYDFDVRNRLVGMNGFNAQCSPLSASFRYDAVGRRIEKTINGVTTQYVYDGIDIIQEKQNGAVTANYVRTLNIDEPLSRIKADGTIRYYQQDALGSVIALTDETGSVRTTYTYDPFGLVTVSGEASDNPFQYTGRENDLPVLSGVEGGLYYYRARYYSPELQRFISEDPIGFWGGDGNFFSYNANNPVNFTDPSGLLLGGPGAIIKMPTPPWTPPTSCVGGCHPPVNFPPPTPPTLPTPPTIGPPPTQPPSSKRTPFSCYVAAHWEYEMCMSGESRDYNCNKQSKNDNCWTRMQDRLDECLRNAQ